MPPDRRQIAIMLAAVAAFLNLYSPQAVLPLLAESFAVGPAAIAMTITASTLAVALMAPFSGALADVLGRKRVIAVAMLAVVGPTVMTGLAPDLPALVFWRFVQGLMLPPIFAIVVSYIGTEWPPGEATRMTGIYTAAAGFGGFLGRFLPGILADWTGWRAAFLVNAAITLTCAICVITLLPRERHFVRASNIVAALAQMLRHLRNPRLVGTYAIGFGVLFNFIGTFTYINFLLAAPPFNASAAFLGSIFIVYLLGTVTTPFTGRLVARFGRRHFVLGLLAAWACGIGLTLVPWLPTIIAGLAVCTVCGFFCQASSTSFVTITAKEGISAAVGLYVTSFYLGGSLGGVAAGWAWNVGQWPAVVATIVAMLAVMALTVTTVWRSS